MKEITLEATKRGTGRSLSRTLRRENSVPGVYYLPKEEPISIVTTELALRPLVYTAETHIINLKVEGDKPRHAILKDIQFDPITDRIVHFDLLGISADKKFRVEVPVVLKGPAAGQKEGGLVQHILHKMEIECFLKDVPEHIEIDITPLTIGHSIHVRDLTFTNFTVITGPNAALVSVIAPTVEKVEAVAAVEGAEAAPAEPELIATKGKKDEEGAVEGKKEEKKK